MAFPSSRSGFARALAVGAGTLLVPSFAAAQGTTADISLARQLGNEGLALAASGDCAGAVEKLKRAEGLYHAPTTLTVLGECHITLGKLVDGVEELTRVGREDLGPRAPAAFRKAQIRARQKLESARPRLPKLHLLVDLEGGGDDSSLTLKIDGQAVPVATLGLDRPADPGAHTIDATAIGYRPASSHVFLREGTTETVKLKLEQLHVAAPPAPLVVAQVDEQAAPADKSSPSDRSEKAPAAETRRTYAPAVVSYGVGASGLVVGAILGIATLSKASHLSSVCQPRTDCPQSEQDELNGANQTALGSTIAFGVGVAGVVLGTYFALRPPTSEHADAKSAALVVRPWVGPGSAGLTGSF